MGWRIPFYSSFGSDFNYDFGVSFKPEDMEAGRAVYNYQSCDPGIEDLSGNNVFYRDESGDIFHTYSNYARGGEDFLGIYRILEVTPKGRNEPARTTRSPTGCGRTTCTARAAKSRPPAATPRPSPAACEPWKPPLVVNSSPPAPPPRCR